MIFIITFVSDWNPIKLSKSARWYQNQRSYYQDNIVIHYRSNIEESIQRY